MQIIMFVPGYLTSKTCSSVGDSYLDIYKYAVNECYDFVYLPIPNNNYGDVGNASLDDCLAYVLKEYNEICVEKKLSTDDSITLVGHSMGGLIVSKLVTDEYLCQLKCIPHSIRLINPAIGPITSLSTTVLGTVLSFLPESVLRIPIVPLPVVERNILYPGSMPSSPGMKVLLGSSLLQTTGKLLVNNKKWILKPERNICEHIRIIQCKDDKLVSFEDTCNHANEYNIQMKVLSSEYHAFFDKALLTAVFE
jgi:hypothetical protein